MAIRLTQNIGSGLADIERKPYVQYGLLLAITLLAAALRLYKLGEWSFWIDEVLTVQAAQNPLNYRLTWPRISLALTGWFLQAVTLNEWNARLVPALIGILTLPALYFPIRKMLGARTALVSEVLLAVSPWHLYWSQNARFYTSLMLLYTLALLTFYFAFEQDRALYALASLFLIALAVVERFIALFYVPVVIIYPLLLKVLPSEKPPGLRAKNLLLIALPGIAFGILEIYRFTTTGSSIIFNAAGTFAGQVNHSPLRLLAAIAYRIGLPLICLGMAGGVTLLIQRKRAGVLLCSAAWLPPLALLLLAPFAFTEDRYAFVSLPFWIVLGAVAVHELLVRADKLTKILALGVLVLLVADPLSQDLLYYQHQHGNRSDWRAAFALVDQEMAEDDLVLTTIPALGHYYLNDQVGWIDSMDPGAIQRADQRVWFVIDQGPGYVTPDMHQWIRAHAQLIRVFELSEPGNGLSIYIYLYDPAQASPSTGGLGHPGG